MQGITGRKSTLTILNNLSMEWKKGFLYLTATDLETTIQERLEARVYKEGKASVPSRKPFEIVRELSGETIQVQRRENHWINIQCEKSVFNLSGVDPDYFPSLPVPEESFVFVSLRALNEMIEKTAFAAASEERGYRSISNVLFVWQENGGQGKLRLVTTDGCRLSLVERPFPFIKGNNVGVLIPKKSILEVKGVLEENEGFEEVGIYFSGSHGFFQCGFISGYCSSF
jgi:DNA polymerase-3 subunit beta